MNTGQGDQYDRSALRVSSGQAILLEEPDEGTRGRLLFSISWSYGWFGSIDYTFRDFDKLIRTGTESVTDSVCPRLQSHSGAWFGDTGKDNITFTLPPGHRATSAKIIVLNGSATITNLTQLQGQTGSITVEVSWNYGWFSRVDYQVCVSTIAIGLSLQLADLTIKPTPAVAGQKVTGQVTVTNNGSISIDEVDIVINVTALTLEDVAQWILDGLDEETRTQEVFRDTRALNLSAGAQSVETQSIDVLETIPAGNNPSSAGTYRLVFRILLPGDVELANIELQSFNIVK